MGDTRRSVVTVQLPHWRKTAETARLSVGWTLHVVAGGTPARFGRRVAARAAGAPWVLLSQGHRESESRKAWSPFSPLDEGRPVWLLSAISASKPFRRSTLAGLSTTNGSIFRPARELGPLPRVARLWRSVTSRLGGRRRWRQ
jgi:hypothetical protein